MVIVHVGIAAHFTENMNYQDNILSEMNQKDGNEVTYITDSSKYVNGNLVYVGQEDCFLSNGVRLIRIEYDKVLGPIFTKKILKAHSVLDYLKEIKPDVILYHGTGGYTLLYVAEYVKHNPGIKFYVDCHASDDNSSQNIFSWILNRYVHGLFLKKALPYIDKVFYVAEDSKIYLRKYYHIKDELMEWFPLGGIIFSVEKKDQARHAVERELGLNHNSIIFTHSGKLDAGKRTIELIKAFKNNSFPNATLLLIGLVKEEIKEELFKEIDEDKRVIYLGWKKGDELLQYLLATDMYCQPGTVSATLQNAICCGCAIMTYPWETYKVYDNGNIIWVKNQKQIEEAFDASFSRDKLKKMSRKSIEFAEQYLDYKIIAQRLYR